MATLNPISPEDFKFGERLPILPIRNALLFPTAVAPFEVGRPKSLKLVQDLEKSPDPYVAIFAQRDPKTDDPTASELYPFGTAARVLKVIKHSSGSLSVILQGGVRIRLDEVVSREPYLMARVSRLHDVVVFDVETEALTMSLKESAKEVVELTPEMPREALALIDSIEHPGQLADLVATNLDMPIDQKSDLIQTVDVKERIRKVLRVLMRQAEILRMREKIRSQVSEEMSKTQREYMLRQQLKAIKEELGEDADESGDLDGMDEKISKMDLPDEARETANKQLKRLKSMQMGSAEYTVARTYLDWILDLPWRKETADQMDIPGVRKVLDEDHHGLEKVKKRIVEYLAVRKLKPEKKGPILCLVGPPGVGKTSLGRSIARALGRKFVRISLGGVHDEAAIRGHRRTYVGALPGQIVQQLKKAGTRNPVFMMDEVDKIGHDFRGDPAAALLEVLDPEQNDSFSDHYLEIPFDLSKVMFITTANLPDPIPPPLRDRMETLDLPGYTRREKLEIAKRHLLPRQLGEHGLDEKKLVVPPETIECIIDTYTREAGVRNLERSIAGCCRGIAVKIAEGTLKPEQLPATVGPGDLLEYLGPAKFISEVAERTEIAGVATGLVWTSTGGDIIFIEATRMPGKGKLSLTGQLGDVMKESAQAALSYVRANADRYGLEAAIFENSDLHIHVPAGAIPKDGPSAGLPLFVALTSMLTGVRIQHDVAMTGEITLRGRLLPIGGVKEKILAAHRAGIKRVLLPERNGPDLIEVPKEVRDELDLIQLKSMEDALPLVLEPNDRFPASGKPVAPQKAVAVTKKVPGRKSLPPAPPD
ncbi:MAG: endopeptidase La [Deltaproteobacteria bacterium]|nr:endopeptidase La [Deltaproteobacteria bacterium]